MVFNKVELAQLILTGTYALSVVVIIYPQTHFFCYSSIFLLSKRTRDEVIFISLEKHSLNRRHKQGSESLLNEVFNKHFVTIIKFASTAWGFLR